MQAITSFQTTLTAKIDLLQTDFGLMRGDMDTFCDRLGEVERRVGKSEDSAREQGSSIHILQVKMKALESRAEDNENRRRRNNLRVVGLPEGAEDQDSTIFTEHLLRTLLPWVQFSPQFAVKRAHSMLPVQGPQGSPPRTFYFRLLNFQDLALQEAQKVEELRFFKTKCMLFPDYSVETQRLRRTFVKAQL